MLNTQTYDQPVLKREVELEEKIDWFERSLQKTEFFDGSIDPTSEQFIEIDRNLKDNTFNVVASKRALKEDVIFTVNNQQAAGVVSAEKGDDGHVIETAHRSLFKNVHLDDVSEITARNAFGRPSTLIYSITLFPQVQSLNKNVTLEEGQYLKLKSINTIKFSVTPKSDQVGDHVVTKDEKMKIEKTFNYTYIVPRPFNATEGNKTLFDIYTSNSNGESTFADYSIEDGKLTATSLSKSGLTTHFNPATSTKENEEEKDFIPDDATKIGEVQLYDNQFYNYDSNKVEVGYGPRSEQGLLVPYNFSGDYSENVKMTPNAAFKDLTINMVHHIDQPLLNKYDGKVVLKIDNKYDKVAGPYNIIMSDKIKMLADNDPTLSGLERISVA